MQPQIRYAKTSDGVNIAYATFGDGPALIFLGIQPVTHIEVELRLPGFREFTGRYAHGKQFVMYDGRNSGLSDRGVPDISLDARVRDLHAVVDALELPQYALFASNLSAPVAIAAAATRPDRVSHLILHDPFVDGADGSNSHRARGLAALLQHDWVTYTESWAGALVRWSDPDQARDLASLMRAAVTPADLERYNDLPIDATALLADVRTPTLIVRTRDAGPMLQKNAQTAARGIANAELVVIEGVPFTSEAVQNELIAPLMDRFMGLEDSPDDDRPADDVERAAQPSAFRTILFTDLVDHTKMMQRLGDARGRDLLREHERITREALSAHGGTEVKTDGDSFMASFASVSSAVECAIALQRAFAKHSETNSEPILVRMGLNVGEPIEEGGDYFGSAVILGARIKDQAGGGDILVPEAVRHMLSGKSFVFSDRGEFGLKGFEDAVRLYEVRWTE